MNGDLELDSWRQQWQRQPAQPSAAALKESVLRETRRVKVMMLAPVAVSVGMGGWAFLRAWLAPEPAAVTLAIGVWSYIALAWAGCLWIARGTWRPRGETTAAFLQLAIGRCESALKSVPFGIALYAFELAFMGLWAVRNGVGTPAEVATAPPMIVIGWLGGPLFVVLMLWYARRKRAELVSLRELQRQLDED
jgi:hypothetical protein